MKAFLLAAGRGTRLRPLTDSLPKCLAPIQGVPLLAIWLDLCARHGISDVLLNLHHLPEQVLAFLDGYAGPVRVTAFFEEQLLGSGRTIRENRAFVAGEECFFILYADNLTTADLTALRQFHERHQPPLTLGLFTADSPRECGIASLSPDGRVTSFVEKPERPASRLANAGLYVAGPDLLAAIPDGEGVDLGLHVLPRLVGQMYGAVIQGYFLDIGTPTNYRRAQAEWPGLGAPYGGPTCTSTRASI